MLTWELFRHYLFSRRAGALVRRIAWICFFGISIGVFSLIVVLSVMNGFHLDIRERLLAVEPHLTVEWGRDVSIEKILGSRIYQNLQANEEVRVAPMDRQDVIVRTVEGYFGGAVARGTTQESFDNLMRRLEHRSQFDDTQHYLAEGSNASQLESGEVFVGIDLARTLGIYEGDRLVIVPPETLLLPPGETPIYDTVRVKGILETRVADIDSKGLFYARDRTLLRLRHSASRQVGLELRLQNPTRFENLKQQLEGQGLKVTSWVDRNSALFFALKLEKFMMALFLGLSTMIASFSIVVVLVLLMSQKRYDIGVLMAMGLSQRRTVFVFAKLGMILSGLGVLTGAGLGIVLCLYIQYFPLDILPDIYINSTIPAKVDPLYVTAILSFALLLSAFGSFVPAILSSRFSPVEVLSQRPQATQ